MPSQLHRLGQPLREVDPHRAVVVDGGRSPPRSAFEGDAIAEARVGLTNMGATPLRARGVEEALVGQPATAEAVRAAAEHVTEGTAAPSDADAASDYREHLARVLTGRAVLAAVG